MTTFVTDGSHAGPKELARPNPTQQIPRKNRMARRIAAAMTALAILAMPTKAAIIFQETGGQVVIEAEHFTARTANADGGHWQVVPDEGQPAAGTPVFANSRGSYVSSQPDSNGGGLNHNGATDAIDVPPFIDYKVNIATAGEYQIWMRWGGYDGSSDSIYAQILEMNAAEPRWYRFARSIGGDFASAEYDTTGAVDDNTAGGNEVPAVWTMAAGTWTIRITQREDGSALDTIVFQLSSMANPAPLGNSGPAESNLAEGFILSRPADVTALPPATATFTAVSKTGPGATVTYQWQSAAPGTTTFADISGATSVSYTTGPTTQAMSGTQYRVVATSGGVTLTSAAATLITDSTPPSLVHAFSGPANTSVTLNFSEKLDSASATTAGNYTIAGLTVSKATLSTDGKTVYLVTTAQTASTAYTVTVNGVKDVPGNVLNGGTANFKGPVDVPGKLIVRKYEGIAGTAVGNLTGDAKYPDKPTSVTQWSAFGGDSIFPSNGDNLGDNYGLEITGFVIPSVTADYVFYISSDDASQLWLSTDETAANATLIAQERACCNQFTYQPGFLSSSAIHLEQGKRYYVRGYLKEGGGGDFVSVAWRNTVTDGDPTVAPTGQLEGIPTDNLATGYDPSGSVSVTTQPTGITVKENAPFSFTVAYSAYSPLLGTTANVQWQSAPAGSSTFTDIPGATSVNYGGTFAKASQSGTQYRAVVTSGDVSATSNPATLTVSGSVPLITLPKTIEHRFFANNAVATVDGLRANPNFPNNPTLITFEPLFEFPPNAGNGYADNYGNRLSGWLLPPADGDYVLFTCSDDPSELWLSTDQDPANKKLIAKELVWSNSRQWTSSGGNSDLTAKRSDQFAGTQWPVKDTVNGGALIHLTANQPYYIEVLHTEGGGGDDVGVAWKLAADPDPTDGDPPISSDNVEQIYAVTGTITFTTQPATQSKAANTAATFTAAATSSDNSPITYIWEMAPKGSSTFTPIGGGASFTTALLTPADDGNQYRVLATSPTGAGVSDVATLTVTVDNVPPTVTYFAGQRKSALVVFSEPVDPTTGADVNNYTITPSGSVTAATVGTTAAGLGTVTLDLSGLVNLQTYTLTIKNVKDTATNPLAAPVVENFTAYDIYDDFNGPAPAPKATLVGSANIKSSGSFDGSGFLELTKNVGSLQGTIGIDDVLAGDTKDEADEVTAKFKLFVGNGSGNAADGFSFNVDSTLDPTTTNTGEDGSGSGLSVAFDTYDNGGGEAPSIEVRWGGTVFATTVGSTTPVVKSTLVNNQWVDVFIQMKGDPTAGTATITVIHNNVKYFDNVDIPGWAPIATPKVIFGARTGGEFETHNIDNYTVIFNTDVAAPSPPTISITSPANGASLPGGSSQTITVNAQAAAGVKQVQYFANGSSLGTVTTAPYSFTIPQAPPGYYVLTATITDNNNVAVTSVPVNVTVQQPAAANAKKILFIVATAGPNASNVAEANHLFGLGYDVYLEGAAGSVLTDADGKAAVVISSTVASGDVGDKFVTTATPVFEWENALEDNFLLTLNGAADHGTTAGQTTIDILPGAVGHKLAAGLSGTVTVTTAGDALGWGLPTSSAKQIATISGNAAQTAIHTVEAGDTLIDGASKAAGRRVFFFLGDSTFLILTADGIKLFDAGIDYTVNGPGGTVQPATLSASSAGGNITVTWTNGGTLYSAPAVTGPWTTTGNNTGTFTGPATTGNQFFKVQNP